MAEFNVRKEFGFVHELPPDGASTRCAQCNKKRRREHVADQSGQLEFILKYFARSGGHLACNLKALVCGKYELGGYCGIFWPFKRAFGM